jgi:hypothetical protein
MVTDNRSKLSKNSDVAEAMDYMLKAWPVFTAFLDDGRICLTNNAAERALRGIALGRKSWLFAGSDRGGQRTAFMLSLIATAKLNDIDPQAWLANTPTSPRTVSKNCCHGIGEPPKINAKPPDPRPSPNAYQSFSRRPTASGKVGALQGLALSIMSVGFVYLRSQ